MVGAALLFLTGACGGDDDDPGGPDAAPELDLPEPVDLSDAASCAELAGPASDAVEAHVAVLGDAHYEDIPDQFDVNFERPREAPEGPPADFGEAVDQALYLSQEQRASFVAAWDARGCSDADLEGFCTDVRALDPARDTPAAVYTSSYVQELCGPGS